MVQFKEGRDPLLSLGESLGTGIGGGLSQLLSSHVANKARKYEENSLAQKLAPYVGGMEKAQALAALVATNPKAQQSIIANLFQQDKNKAEEAQEERLRNFEIEQDQKNAQVQAPKVTQPLANPLLSNQQEALSPNGNGSQELQKKQEQISPIKKEKIEPRVISPQNEIVKYKEAFKRGIIKHSQLVEQQKIADKKQTAIDKETYPYYEKIHKESEAAKDNVKRLDDLQRLIDKGNLADPLAASYFETLAHGIFGFGFNLKSLMNADSQEFDKISTDLIKTAKQYFGAKLTDLDLKTFLRTIPTLSMSDAAKRRVIKNMRYFADASLLRNRVMNDIIHKNGGERPKNLMELVDAKVDRKMDKLAQQFKNNLKASQEDVQKLESTKDFLEERDIPQKERDRILGVEVRGNRESFEKKRSTREEKDKQEEDEARERQRERMKKKQFAESRRSEFRSPRESFSKKG